MDANSIKAKYVIQCDKLRYNNKGEQLWQNMMKNKKSMYQHNFVNYVDVKSLLGKQTLYEFLFDDDSSSFYSSKLGSVKCYFIQTKGFEFIFI